MPEITFGYGCDGCYKTFPREELNPAQTLVWRRIDGEPVLTKGDRLFCDKCLAERTPSENI